MVKCAKVVLGSDVFLEHKEVEDGYPKKATEHPAGR